MPKCLENDKIPREQWHVNKAFTALQGQDDQAENEGNDSDDESVQSASSTSSSRSGKKPKSKKGWGNYQIHSAMEANVKCEMVHKQANYKCQECKVLKDVILLDTGSSIGGTFMNPELVTRIKSAKQPIQMTTNAGNKNIGLEGKDTGFGQVYFDSTQMANIFWIFQYGGQIQNHL